MGKSTEIENKNETGETHEGHRKIQERKYNKSIKGTKKKTSTKLNTHVSTPKMK